MKYVKFKSFKKAYGDEGSRESIAYMHELSLEAFDTLLNLCESKRYYLNTNNLVVFDR